jgi:hypothetical protein
MRVSFRHHTVGARGGFSAAGLRISRRKSKDRFPQGSCQCAPQIIFGIGVAAREMRTAEPEDSLHSQRWHMALQQLFGNPEIHDAPVGSGKPLQNTQAIQPVLINRGSLAGGQEEIPLGRREVIIEKATLNCLRCLKSSPWGHHRKDRDRLDGRCLRSHYKRCVPDFHPGGQTRAQTSLGFLIGEASQSTQMVAIGAGRICPIQLSQLSGEAGSSRECERIAADPHPGLKMAGAGFGNHARLMAVSDHSIQNCRVNAVQIYQDVASIAARNKGSKVNVISLAVASPEKPNDSRVPQLRGSPQAFTRKSFSTLPMDQPDQITFARHRLQLLTDGCHCESKSAISIHGLSPPRDWLAEKGALYREILQATGSTHGIFRHKRICADVRQCQSSNRACIMRTKRAIIFHRKVVVQLPPCLTHGGHPTSPPCTILHNPKSAPAKKHRKPPQSIPLAVHAQLHQLVVQFRPLPLHRPRAVPFAFLERPRRQAFYQILVFQQAESPIRHRFVVVARD